MVFQVGGRDGFAPGGNAAFDARQGFLVELLRAFRGGDLVFVAATVVGTGHGGFDLALPCMAFWIAMPVLVVQSHLVACLGRKVERVLGWRCFAQRQLHGLGVGQGAQFLRFLIAGDHGLLARRAAAIRGKVNGRIALPVATVELPLHPGLVGLVVDGAVVQQVGAFVERLAHQQRVANNQGRRHEAATAQRRRSGRTTGPAARVAGQSMGDLGLRGGGVALLQQRRGCARGHDRICASGQKPTRTGQTPSRCLPHQQLHGGFATLATRHA